ncbi:GGDEF domain-containing protein [Parasphingorhabdus sp.]|uniref:GGDEF domain-containing protein n=1 Tax=Parasphingorhabdus sp. TaxID=2709688 RepID=UPI003A9026FF
MKKNKSSNEQNCVTCAVLQRETGDLKRDIAEMDQHVYLDTLTGLPNRRYFVQSLQSRVERCRRYGDMVIIVLYYFLMSMI